MKYISTFTMLLWLSSAELSRSATIIRRLLQYEKQKKGLLLPWIDYENILDHVVKEKLTTSSRATVGLDNWAYKNQLNKPN